MRGLLALLALIGLLAVPGTPLSATCPQQATMPMHMMHHGQTTPSPHDPMTCAVCIAVLPSLAPVEPHATLQMVQPASLSKPLPGIDPSLDPPPPRAA
jgi:hypothetical protein